MVANVDPAWRTRESLVQHRKLAINHAEHERRKVATYKAMVPRLMVSDGMNEQWQLHVTTDWRGYKGPKRQMQGHTGDDIEYVKSVFDGVRTNADVDRILKRAGMSSKDKKDRWSVGRITRRNFSQKEGPRRRLGSSGRIPHTNMTHIYANGEMGRQRLQFGKGKISRVDIDWANETFGKDIKVVCFGHNSHMFNSWTFIDWLNTDCRYEVDKQRQTYNEPMTMPYYLIFDMGPDHTAWKEGRQLRIEQISKELNMIIKCMPAGGSAHGQPADQIHNLIHAYNRMWQMRRTQTYDNIYL